MPAGSVTSVKRISGTLIWLRMWMPGPTGPVLVACGFSNVCQR